jgi:hypothetical protein
MEDGMTDQKPIIFIATLLVTGLLALSCGEDVVIDVNTLPCGTAQGNSASGNFDFSGLVLSDNCADVPAYFSYPLLDGTADIVVNHYEPQVEGCEHGRLEILFPASGSSPSFTLAGGVWTDGSFRIGQAVAVQTGETFRILFDGKFAPMEEGAPPQDFFSGKARVDIAGTIETECTYKVEFSATRQR